MLEKGSILGYGTRVLTILGNVTKIGNARGILATPAITILLLSVAASAVGATYIYSLSIPSEPQVQVTSLAGDEVLAAGLVKLRGTAADDGPIQAISVIIDGGPPIPVVPAFGDFSEWSVMLPISSPGNHTIEIQAADSSGKTGTTMLAIFVRDAESVMAVPQDQTVEATGPSGALVSYPLPTAQDGVRNLDEPECLPASGGMFPIGTTTVTCTADYVGGTVSASFAVSVRDTTAPAIAAPADVSAENPGVAFMKISLGSPVVNDAVDENPMISNDAPANGFGLGTTKVVWTATDDYGNVATATQQVTVTAAAVEDASSSNENVVERVGSITYSSGGGGGGGGSSGSSSSSDSKDENRGNNKGDNGGGSGGNKGGNSGNSGSGSDEDTAAPSVSITSPAGGATTQLGTLAVSGTASDNSGVSSVQVRLDGGSYVAATPKAAGDWSTWLASFNISEAGSHTVTARATDSAGNTEESSVAITAEDDSVPEEDDETVVAEDTAAPSVAIVQPEADSVVTMTGENVLVTGTAFDSGSGVEVVEVRVDDGDYFEATPKAAGDWSSWSVTLPVGEGEHRLVPRATDSAGNQAWNSIFVTFGEPVVEDPTSPAVEITSPADGSTISLEGGTIAIQGTASDSGSGIDVVEVRVDDGEYFTATPRADGDWSSWSISLPVGEGERRIVPRATDNSGNQAWNSIYVMVDIQDSDNDNGGDGDTTALDEFGIEKLYPTAPGGNEWYVDMDDPTSDPLFRNLPSMTRQPDGSWQVDGGSRGQVRMEAWSPSGEKWLNVEITGYAKMVGGSNELIQWYSRGGHHTSSNECLGSAVKARLYGDGEARWVKEINHPAYTGNRGSVQATNTLLEDRWIGFKAVIYNFVEDGKTYVRMESYIDDDVTDSNDNLVIDNNWQLASVVEDRGGWGTDDSDFNPGCAPLNKDSMQEHRQSDEILNMPGGTSTQNIAAWRSDDLTWNFKYLSVREIAPT